MSTLDETLGFEVIDAVGGDPMVLAPVVVAPVTEELLKGLGVAVLFFRMRREFNGITDGIVYAGIIAAGFAFVENILYLGRAFAEDEALVGQGGGVLAVLILRGILSPFAHPLFTSMIGIGCGLAATSRSGVARVLYVLVGYGFAVLLHALWNGPATLGDGGAFLGVYLFIMVPLFLGMVGLVVWHGNSLPQRAGPAQADACRGGCAPARLSAGARARRPARPAHRRGRAAPRRRRDRRGRPPSTRSRRRRT